MSANSVANSFEVCIVPRHNDNRLVDISFTPKQVSSASTADDFVFDSDNCESEWILLYILSVSVLWKDMKDTRWDGYRTHHRQLSIPLACISRRVDNWKLIYRYQSIVVSFHWYLCMHVRLDLCGGYRSQWTNIEILGFFISQTWLTRR